MPDTNADTRTVATVANYLDTHNVLNLATSSADGPWAAAVFFVRNGSQFYFLSAPHTRHCINIQSQPRVAGTVQREVDDWEKIKGVQLEGICRLVPDEDRARVIDLYAQKFTVTGPDAPPPIAKALDKVGWYSITPDALWYIDNSQGLGHRKAIDITALESE